MLASNHIITLHKQRETLEGSDLWDPASADNLIQTSVEPLHPTPKIDENSSAIAEELLTEEVPVPSNMTSTS